MTTRARKQTDSETFTAGRAYSQAESRLKKAHASEFQALLEEEYAKAGLTYKRRRTAQEREIEQQEAKRERAAAKVQQLVAEYGETILPEAAAG